MDPEQILQFWFAASAADAAQAKKRYAFWFKATPEIDAAIRTRFVDLVAQAQAGGLESWETAPRSWLALIILLDQFPRNLYRGTAAAFAGDPLAQHVAQRGFGQYLPSTCPSNLSVIEQAFCLMPLQHAEQLSLQEEALRRGEELLALAATEWQEQLEEFQGSARKHFALIQRFGRFPHRNVILGRESTLEEQEFLDSGSGSFGQALKK